MCKNKGGKIGFTGFSFKFWDFDVAIVLNCYDQTTFCFEDVRENVY